MTEGPFKLIVTGRLAAGSPPASARENARRILNLPQEKIDRLFDEGKPLAFGNLDEKTARRFQERLKRAGIEARVQKPALKTKHRLTCPGCKKVYNVKGSLAGKRLKCPACGADIMAQGRPPAVRKSPPPIESSPAVTRVTTLITKTDRLLNLDAEELTDEELESALSLTDDIPPSPKRKIRQKDLSSEAGEIVRDKKLVGRRRAGSWLKLLRELARYDEVVNVLKKRLTAWIGAMGLLACISLYLTIRILEHELVFEGAAAAGFTVLCLIGCAGFMYRRFMIEKTNLVNDFHQLLLPFLLIILPDVPRREKIYLNLDLAGFSKNKMAREDELDPGRYKSRTKTVFHDPWCEMETPLIGGARLRLEIVNTLIDENRQWKNESGKIKIKIKYKKTVVVTVELTPDGNLLEYDRHRLASMSAQEKVKFIKKKGRESFRLIRKFKFKQNYDELDITASPDDLVEMYFQLASALKSADGMENRGNRVRRERRNPHR